MRSVESHRRLVGWSGRSGAIALLLVSALLAGCEVLVMPIATIAVSAAMVGGDLAARASYDASRKAAIDSGLANREFGYPMLVVEEEAFPAVAISRGWTIDGGKSRSCGNAVVVSGSRAPLPPAEAGVRVRVKCFYVGGPWPSSPYPDPSTVVVASSVVPGDDDAARAFGVEILDALGAYLASVEPQAVDKVFDEDVAAVRSAIARLADGWSRKIDILERDTTSSAYRVEYRSPVGAKWTTMNIGLTGVGATTTVTVVGDGSLSEGAFRSEAVMFLHDLSAALEK